jgi:hypothetical protein
MIGFALLLSSAFADDFFYYNGEPFPVQLSDSLVTVVVDSTAKGAKYTDADCIDTTFEPITVNSSSTTYRIKEEYTINEALTQLRNIDNVEVANPVIGSPDSTPVYLTDEFIVRFDRYTLPSDIDLLLQWHSIEVVEVDSAYTGTYLLRMTKESAEDVLAISNIIYEDGSTEYSAPNFHNIFVQDGSPDDQYYSYQWYLENDDPNFPNADIHFEPALDFAVRSDPTDTVVVGIVDAGFDRYHEDLDSNLFYLGYDAAGDQLGTAPDAEPWLPDDTYATDTVRKLSAHGMNVLGIVNAMTNNSTGISGIAPFCRYMLIKVCDNLGRNTVYTVNRGMQATAAMGWTGKCDIMVAPWHTLLPHSAIDQAMKQNWQWNVVPIFSSGSIRGDAQPPGLSQYAICVGATNRFDIKMNLSAGGDALDVVAPGKDIWTLDRAGVMGVVPYHSDYECLDPDYHCDLDGPSASCAIAGGIAARVLARVKDARGKEQGHAGVFGLTFDYVKATLCGSADDMVGTDDIACWDSAYGYGRVNLHKAMIAVSGGDPNNDALVDIDDIVYLINYVFGGGAEPYPHMRAGDCNCSGGDVPVDIDDIVYLINFVFGGGPSPQMPCFKHYESCVEWPME